MTTPTMIITPRRPALLVGHDNELDVLVRIQAPDAPAELPKRNPLHLALVIDRSGSMSGQPLEEAKRCAEFVLDGLQATDRLSVVAYDNEVRTLVPSTGLEDKESVRQVIRAIDSGGSTDLHGGWFRGAETLAPRATDGSTSRVILLSDGCECRRSRRRHSQPSWRTNWSCAAPTTSRPRTCSRKRGRPHVDATGGQPRAAGGRRSSCGVVSAPEIESG